MYVSNHTIEEIRNKTNIVDIIETVVRLKKRGKNYQGLCPFHNEKTPSFNVNPEKQIYKCFGCGKGGDVFTFLVEYKKISFGDAIRELADRLGIKLEFENAGDKTKLSERDEFYELNSAIGRYFYDLLMKHPDARIARDYLQSRGIKQQTINTFGLGYALSGRTELYHWMKAQNLDIQKALALGVIGENERGTYDRFAGRLIYPIFAPGGRIAAFAGRILEKRDDIAKYVNSPESGIYTKGKILYGINLTKDEIRNLDSAIIVEGYMDLISLYQHGVKNVVAVSGTSLTDDQVMLLSRYTKRVNLIFDADSAGVRAAMRSIEILLKMDFDIMIVELDKGEDPDSYIQQHGREKFEDRVSKAVPFLEFQYKTKKLEGAFDDPGKTSEAIRDMLRPLARMGDMLKRSLLLQDLAKRTGLRESILDDELKHLIKDHQKSERREENYRREEQRRETPVENRTLFTPPANKPRNIAEQELIKLLYEGDLNSTSVIAENIHPEDFANPLHQKLAVIVYTEYDDNNDVSFQSLNAKIDDEELREYLYTLTVDQYTISERWNSDIKGWQEEDRMMRAEILLRRAFDTIKKLKTIQLDERIAGLQAKMAETSDKQVAEELYKEIWELTQEKLRVDKEFTFAGK